MALDYGAMLNLLEGSNKDLIKKKIADFEAMDEPVQGQYPDSPDAPSVTGSPVPTGTPYDISRYPDSPDMSGITTLNGGYTTDVPTTPNAPVYPQPRVVSEQGQGLALSPDPSQTAQQVFGNDYVRANLTERQKQALTQAPMTELEAAQAEARWAREMPVKKDTAKWKDILAYIVQGANAAFNPQPGQKIVGYGQVKKDNAIRNAEQKLATVQGETMKSAQIKQALEAPELAAARLQAQKQQKIVDGRGKIANMRYFDPKNALHRQLAMDVGMNPDELGWDNRKADRITVAGQTYTLDPATKVWGPAEGLPTDKSQEVVEYEVTMPDADGKYTTRIFKVKSGDAAKFAMQMNMMDAQFKQRDKEADTKFKRDKEMLELRERMDVRMKEIDLINDQIKEAVKAQNQQAEITLKAKLEAETKALKDEAEKYKATRYIQ